jgi:agmatine deiminase
MTPRELGYRMPAEWEPHEATWLAWPHEETDWPGKFEPIAWVYADFVKRVSRVERVRILVPDADRRAAAADAICKAGANLAAVDFYEIPTDRSWTRDFCPIFIKRPGEVAMTDWIFNGWAKYDNWTRDNAVPSALAPQFGMQRFEPGLVLEGGSIDVNGAGALLTTEECLLSDVQARNPERSREEIERAFHDYFGVDRVLWLKNGVTGDDTHGHVDDLARFVSRSTIVTAVEMDRGDANYKPLRENYEILRSFGSFRIAALPMPEPVYFDGQRLPASYANFYIANKMVLVPTFNDPNDRVALNILADLFQDREVIGVACLDLVLGLGTLHCMTQQQPAA